LQALAYGSVGFYVLHDYIIAYNFNGIFLSARIEGEEIYVIHLCNSSLCKVPTKCVISTKRDACVMQEQQSINGTLHRVCIWQWNLSDMCPV